MRRGTAAILVTLVLIFMAQPAMAEPAWELGFLGGANLSKLTGDTKDLPNFRQVGLNAVEGDVDGTRPGGAGGLFAMVNITPLFGLRLESFFSMKGGKGDISGTLPYGGTDVDFTGTYTMKLIYVEVPLLATFSFPAGESVVLRGMAGGAVGLKASSKFKFDITAVGQSDSHEFDADDFIKGSDFGGVAGIEAAFRAGPMNVLLDARWTVGFSNIIDEPNVQTDIKNSNIALMAGLGFPIGGGDSGE